MPSIDITLLYYQLEQAGLRIVGCDAGGQVWWADGYEPTPDDLDLAAQIVRKHDPETQELPEVTAAKRLAELAAKLEAGTATTAERNEMLLRVTKLAAAAAITATTARME